MPSSSEHSWDTEPKGDVIYTPPAHYDRPWVIRMCCNCETPGCSALLIDKGDGKGPVVYVSEPSIDTVEGQRQADYIHGIKDGVALVAPESRFPSEHYERQLELARLQEENRKLRQREQDLESQIREAEAELDAVEARCMAAEPRAEIFGAALKEIVRLIETPGIAPNPPVEEWVVVEAKRAFALIREHDQVLSRSEFEASGISDTGEGRG